MEATLKARPFSLIEWIRSVSDEGELTPATRLVAVRLALYADAKSGRKAFPGNARLSDDLGIAQRTVERALHDLAARGIVRRESLGSKGGRKARASEWTLVPPPWDQPGGDAGNRRADSGSPDIFDAEHPTSTTGSPDRKGGPPAHGSTHGSAHGWNYSGHAAARPRRTPPRTPETGPLRTVDQWEPNPSHRKHAEDLGVDYDEALDAFLDRFGCLHGCTDLPARSSLNATFTAFIDAIGREGGTDSLDEFPDHRYDCPHQENPW